MGRLLVCGDTTIDLTSPVVMGILNVTPDSFSDGGLFVDVDKALDHCRNMVAAGAQIIDVGGESSRPGAQEINEQLELDRVIPVIERIKSELSCVISIDTTKAAVMQAAVTAGARFINDINALQSPGCVDVAVRHQIPVCLMHMQGNPRSMQTAPNYEDVVKEVHDFLQQRASVCLQAGLEKRNIVIDPGFGFGKTVAHNLLLLKHLEQFTRGEFPVLVGMSRKSTLGAILDKPVEYRLSGSLAANALLADRGASIFRVHDVAETIDVLKVCSAVANIEHDQNTTG